MSSEVEGGCAGCLVVCSCVFVVLFLSWLVLGALSMGPGSLLGGIGFLLVCLLFVGATKLLGN